MTFSGSTQLPNRFRTIDGLRGIAALSVVAYHLGEVVSRSSDPWLPQWTAYLVSRGYLGVDVFFVISGFVIAFSVRGGRYTPQYLARFALRRSFRLDPPYWTAIVLELGLVAAGNAVFPSLHTALPGTAKVLSHFVYAQNLLGYGDVLPIFWTLCCEVQFYVFFVSLLVLWEAVGDRLPARWRARLPGVFFAAMFCVSLAVRYSGVHLVPGLAIDRWFQFFLGVLTWWVVSGTVSLRVLAGALGAVVLSVVAWRAEAVQLLPVLVVATVVITALRGRLDSFLGGRTLQFLGRISYSIYLFHLPITWRLIALFEGVYGGRMGWPLAWAVFLAGMGVTVAVSGVLWWLIERPSLHLAKRISLPRTALAARGRLAERRPEPDASVPLAIPLVG
jgi:peptidoglycan/LPS O-acetylase OafA/YrhL